MKINEQSILITGASEGLGKAIALRLARQGARLTLVARRPAPLQALVDEIRARGGTAFGIPADIADKYAIHPIAAQAAELAGPIDILINNASTLGPTPLPLLLDTECEDLARVFETNVMGPFRLTKVLSGPMALRKWGLVVSLSSDAAVAAYPNWGAYGTSKAAFDHLTRIWAAELADTGVRFLNVDPGEMDTRMHADAIPDADRTGLLRVAEVADRILRIIEESERIPTGTRVLAGDWRSP